jgi:protease I
MDTSLRGKRVAILLTNGFEQVEMTEPRRALDQAGAETELIAPPHGQVQGMNHREKGDHFTVNFPLKAAHPDDYDALLLPGGVLNSDELRTDPDAVAFVKSFFDNPRPVAAICHGIWMLIEAGVVRGKTLTSWPSLKTDVHNAGGNWVDREVARDGLVVTSRKPEDLPAFNRAIIETFAQGAERTTGTAAHPSSAS